LLAAIGDGDIPREVRSTSGRAKKGESASDDGTVARARQLLRDCYRFFLAAAARRV